MVLQHWQGTVGQQTTVVSVAHIAYACVKRGCHTLLDDQVHDTP